MRNPDQNSGSKSVFKPIIATSLALALGVSVASATAAQSAISTDTAIGTVGGSGVVIGTNAYVDTANKKAAGLFVTGSASGITLTFNDNVTMGAIDGSSSNSAYSIYNSAGIANFQSNAFKTITISALPTSTLTEGESLVFKNAGNKVTFKNVAMVVGSGASGNNYGIYSNLAGATYAFGTNTTFAGADGNEDSINASAFTGVILANTATLGGTLYVQGGNGANAQANTRASFANQDGGTGANATGISLGADLTVALAGLTLNVQGGNGGAGANGGINGTGGNATGIVATAASTVSGGDITINLAAGNNGGSTSANSEAILTAISNTGSGTTLAFGNGVQVGVGQASDSSIALLSKLTGVQYNFGSSAAKTTFTITPAQASDGDGASVTGAKILADAIFNGNVEFTVTGGKAKGTTNNGGNATGLHINTGTLTYRSGDLKITAQGGAKDDGGSGTGGVATGILVDGGNFNGNQAVSTTLVIGESTNTSVATGIKLTSGEFVSGALTLGSTPTEGVIATTTATGIDVAANAEFFSRNITFNKVDAATATGITSAGIFSSSDIALGTIGGSTNATAIKLTGGTFSAGNITLTTSLGASATESVTVLELSNANLSVKSLAITSSNVAQSSTANTTLIKNASGASTIQSGSIALDAALQGTAKKIIDNAGTLNFGTAEGSNASLILGGTATTGADVYGFSNKIANTAINFGIAKFYTTGADAKSPTAAQSTIGANLENVTKLSGTVNFYTSATDTAESSSNNDKTATGMKILSTALTNSEATTSQILGDLTLNVSASGKAGATGLDITTTTSSNDTLVFGNKKTLSLSIDTAAEGTGTATGIVIRDGALSLKQASATTDPSVTYTEVGLTAIGTLEVGKVNAQNAVALNLSSGGKLAASSIDLNEGTIGNTENTSKAVAIQVNGGIIGDADINVGNILKASDEGSKYILDVVSTANALTFNGKAITASATTVSAGSTYGLYSGLSNVGYNFGSASSAEGVKFTVAGASGQNKEGQGAGGAATGAIIADDAFFQGKTLFTVTGGTADSTGGGVGGNGGNATGISVSQNKTLTFKGLSTDNSLKLVVDGSAGVNGTEVTAAINGDAVGISLESGSTFDASNATLTLQVGNTNALNATALSLNGSTFAGTFTLDSANFVGNASAASATLIKNTGTSTIRSGNITLSSGGLVAKTSGGVSTIINNTGTLNFGTAEGSNASLTIGTAPTVSSSSVNYGFSVDTDTSINFGTANFYTTGTVAQANGVGMVLNDANTTLQGTITFNVAGASPVSGNGGDAYGIATNLTAEKTLTIKKGSTINVNVDSGIATAGGTNGSAIGFLVKGTNKLGFVTDGALNLQVGTKNASNAIGFRFTGAGAYLDKNIIILDSSTDQIGNENATQSTALLIDSTAGNTSGFSLKVGKGVLVGKKRYVLDLTSRQRTNAITFTTTDSASQTIVAGTVANANGVYGLYSADAGVSYNFGSTSAGAGSIFNVSSAKTNAIGAIIAEDANFEGSANFTVSTTAKDAQAVGIRLDGTSSFGGGFNYSGSSISADATSGTAVALQATGTHTISGDITVNDSALAQGNQKYIFQNIATNGTTTFENASLTAGNGTYTDISIGLESNSANVAYAFGGSGSGKDAKFGTVFKVDGKSYKEADDANKGDFQKATGLAIEQSATFSGNVAFEVTSGVHTNTATPATTIGDAIGMIGTPAMTLTLAPASTLKFIVDTGASASDQSDKAVGISVASAGVFNIKDNAASSPNTLGTQNFVFEVGGKNASIARAIELTTGGQIGGDLYVRAGSVIGNANSAESSAVAIGDGTAWSANSTLVTGQSIIVEEGVTFGKNAYIFKNANFLDNTASTHTTTAITFVSADGGKIQAGTVVNGTPTYGIYHAIAGAGYDFGASNFSDALQAGTTFTITGVDGTQTSVNGGDATGAIIKANTDFAGSASFTVDGGVKMGAGVNGNAIGIDVEGATLTSNSADIALSVGDTNAINAVALKLQGAKLITDESNGFTLKGTVGNTANTLSALGIATSGTTTVTGGGIAVDSLTLNVKSPSVVGQNDGGVAYALQNTGTLTFDNSTLALGGALTSASHVALANIAGNNSIDFGSNSASTIFDYANGQSDTAEVKAINVASGSSLTVKGNATFNVTGGSTNSGNGGNAVGIDLTSGGTLDYSGAKLTLNIDAGTTTASGSLNGSATGIKLSNTAFDDVSSLVFNIGTKNAATVKAVEITGSLANKDIVIDSGVFGNKDYTTDLTVISSQGFTNTNIKIGSGVELNTASNAHKYILKDTVAINNANGYTITVGAPSNTIKQAYSFYNALADAAFSFGTANFTATAEGTQEAVGMILAANTRIEGSAQFTVSADQGNASGIKAIGDNTLTLGSNASLIFNVSSTSGSVAGINAEEGTLKIVQEGSNTFRFNVGNLNQTTSTGVALNNGVFDGSVSFDKVQAKENAYGIKNEATNMSIIKAGTITFGADAFKDVVNWAVIQNDGNLTIARDANIVAGTQSNSSISAGIYNSIKGAEYNLGNLNLDIAKAVGGKTAVGIYSEDIASEFRVATGKSLNISALDAANTQAFGGSVNLVLESGSNVYINTNGGKIASLTAGENAYIYLSGADKASRVGYASSINFRELEVDLIKPQTTNTKALTTQGANFVVLADATRGNGTSYNLDGTLIAQGKGSAYTRDGKLSTTGGSDRIAIKYDVANMSSISAIDNKLNVALSSLGNASNEKYVVLAQVANGYTNITDQNGGNTRLHDLVTFNGLKNNGDSVEVQTQAGFDTANITITRHDLAAAEQVGDWAGVGAVYVSNLVANGVSIDSDMADASVSAISTNYDLVSANLNSLSKRMGELRNTDNAQGVWGRVFAGQQTSNFGAEQKTTYLTFQAGYDYNISLDSGVNYTGLALSYVHSSSTQSNASFLIDSMGTRVEGNANSASDGVEVAVYNSYISDMGLYSDSIVKFGYFSSDLNIPTQDTYTSNNFSFAVSEEVGYRVKLGAQEEWFIDPQVELAYAYVNGSDFTQVIGSSSMKTAQDAISLLRSRLGAAWGYKFDHLGKEKGVKASLYLGTYYAYDMISGGNVNLETNNGTTESYDLKSNGRFVLNVGTDVSVQDTTKFYVDFEKSFGSTMQTDYQVSVGVRYSFGAKDASASKDSKKAAPLKVGEKDTQN